MYITYFITKYLLFFFENKTIYLLLNKFSGWIGRRELYSSFAWMQVGRISVWNLRTVFARQLEVWWRKVSKNFLWNKK